MSRPSRPSPRLGRAPTLLATLAAVAVGAFSVDAHADAAECSAAADCTPRCNQVLAEVNAPSPTRTTFVSSRCGSTGGTAPCVGDKCEDASPPGVACFCTMEGNISRIVGKGQGIEGCLQFGRDHSCLYKESEFPGCDVGAAATSCATVCKDLEGRIQKEAQATHTAQIKEAACVGGGICACVTKVGDACYVEPRDQRQDCGLSASQMWAKLYPSSAGGEGGAGGTPGGSQASCAVTTVGGGSGASLGLLGLGLFAVGVTARRGRRRSRV